MPDAYGVFNKFESMPTPAAVEEEPELILAFQHSGHGGRHREGHYGLLHLASYVAAAMYGAVRNGPGRLPSLAQGARPRCTCAHFRAHRDTILGFDTGCK